MEWAFLGSRVSPVTVTLRSFTRLQLFHRENHAACFVIEHVIIHMVFLPFYHAIQKTVIEAKLTAVGEPHKMDFVFLVGFTPGCMLFHANRDGAGGSE